MLTKKNTFLQEYFSTSKKLVKRMAENLQAAEIEQEVAKVFYGERSESRHFHNNNKNMILSNVNGNVTF